MPTRYKRTGKVSRASWSEERLSCAIEAVRSGTVGVNEASRRFNIPCTTLRRRKRSGVIKKGAQGPSPLLGTECDRKLVAHIKKLQKNGFASTQSIVRMMAFRLAEQLKLTHRFNASKGKAGKDWLYYFLERNKDLSTRKSEGVSLARARGMKKQDVSQYFNLLEETLNEKGLINKPKNLFNMDETGLQLNNRPEYVIAEKGSKNVPALTSGEKGETISLMVCCNAEGTYIPPLCILKSKKKKGEYEDGMPPGSIVSMSEKSAYVNTSIFLLWLETQFIPQKPEGPVVLILDGHSSHVSSVEILEYAEKNDITLLCLPSHTTQFLQPLDRAFFKALKSYYYSACNTFIRANPTRSINRLQFGKLLGEAWSKAATVDNAVSAFRSTGIYPLNPDVIPDYAYISDKGHNPLISENPGEITENVPGVVDLPTTSDIQNEEELNTPGKILDGLYPVQSTSKVNSVKKRSRQLAAVLTSEENIKSKRELAEKKAAKERSKKEKKDAKKPKPCSKQNQTVDSSSSEDETKVLLKSETEGDDDDYENECVGCGENYKTTKSKEDWIRCIECLRWLHEGCTTFVNMCLRCGRKKEFQ